MTWCRSVRNSWVVFPRLVPLRRGRANAAYRRGGEEAVRLCRLLGCEAAVLKERSPSCGYGIIHDGTFSGGLTTGNGVAAQMLAAQGIPVYGESRIPELLK